MKKVIVFVMLIVGLLTAFESNAYAQYEYKPKPKEVFTDTITNKTYKDKTDIIYDIYISKNGSCYIWKNKSNGSGKYKQYLGSEISADVCDKLGREYKSRTSKAKVK